WRLLYPGKRVVTREVQLPLLESGALDVPGVEVQQHVAGDRRLVAREERPYINSIQRPGGKSRTRNRSDGRHQIQHGADTRTLQSFGNCSGHPGNEGLAHSAFVRFSFAAAEAARASLEPGAVVTRKNRESVSGDAVVVQSLNHLADAPVQL